MYLTTTTLSDFSSMSSESSWIHMDFQSLPFPDFEYGFPELHLYWKKLWTISPLPLSLGDCKYLSYPSLIYICQPVKRNKCHFFTKDYKWHRNTEKTDIKRLFTVNLNSFPDRHYLLQSAQLESLSSKEFSSYLLYPSVETTGQGCGTNTLAQGSPCAKHLWTWQQASETQKADKGDKQKTLMVIFRLGKFLTRHYW